MPFTFLKQAFDQMVGNTKVERLTWRQPQIVDRGLISGVSLAMDHSGRGLLLWGLNGELRLMPMRPSQGAGIGNFPVGPGDRSVTVLSDKGLGVALWIEDDPSGSRITGSPFKAASPSFSPSTIYQGEGQIQHLQAAIDRRGSALVVWCVERSGTWEILAQSYDARKARWDEQPVHLGKSTEHALIPRLAMNCRGRALVAWELQEASFEGFVVSHYWTSEHLWSDSPVQGVPVFGHELELTMDNRGDALAVWVARPHGQPARLETARYRTADSVWEKTGVLASGPNVSRVQLRGTEDGRAWLLWLQQESNGSPRIMAKHYVARAWQASAERVDSDKGQAKATVIGCTEGAPPGILFVQQGAQGDAIQFRSWGEQLGPTVTIGHCSNDSISEPQLAMSPTGAIALWRQGEGKGSGLVMAKGL
ncbi:MAG: hypothetical protein Q8O00_10850 [Holophaga sp.]|nr:hypothetical protein [Holophaga sp.]